MDSDPESSRRLLAMGALIGALDASLVAWFVVMPTRDMGPAGGWDVKVIVAGLLLNSTWGLGAAPLIRLMNQSQSS